MGRAAVAMPPDLGVPGACVTHEVQRALVLRYVAGDGHNLPQAAKVRATRAPRTPPHDRGAAVPAPGCSRGSADRALPAGLNGPRRRIPLSRG